jgi:hypothetical protein
MDVSLRFFLKMRRLVRFTQNERIYLITERSVYAREAKIARSLNDPLMSFRIRRLESLEREVGQELREVESTLDDLGEHFLLTLVSLTLSLSPEHRAALLGNTPDWLDAQDPDWRSLSMMGLIQDVMCENEKSTGNDIPALFWFCSRAQSMFGDHVVHLIEQAVEENRRKGSSLRMVVNND